MSPVVITGIIVGLLGFVIGIFVGVFSTMEEVTDLRIQLSQEKTLSEAVIRQLKQKLEEYKNGGDKGDSIHGDVSDDEQPGSDDIWE